MDRLRARGRSNSICAPVRRLWPVRVHLRRHLRTTNRRRIWLITEKTPLRKRILAVLARQDRQRGGAAVRAPGDRLSHDHHQTFAHVRLLADPFLAIGSWDEALHRWLIACDAAPRCWCPVTVRASGRITHSTGSCGEGLSRSSDGPEAIGEDSPHHVRRSADLESDLRLWSQKQLVLSRRFLHVPSDAMVAADPDLLGTLWGDKINSSVFDNSKFARPGPRFQGSRAVRRGHSATPVAWFDADPSSSGD